MVIKAADMLIARRADTRARTDFATWKMMAKLNVRSVPCFGTCVVFYAKLIGSGKGSQLIAIPITPHQSE